MFLNALLDCVGGQGTVLFVAIAANAWSWIDSVGLLDAGVHQREHFNNEFEEGRLVVPHSHAQR